MELLHVLSVSAALTGIGLESWKLVAAQRAWIDYVRLCRQRLDPDYKDPSMPLAGWPIEPGWRENMPRHPKTYLKNWTFGDGFHLMRLRYDEQRDPVLEEARKNVSDLEFNAWMTVLLGGFVIPFVLFVLPAYFS